MILLDSCCRCLERNQTGYKNSFSRGGVDGNLDAN